MRAVCPVCKEPADSFVRRFSVSVQPPLLAPLVCRSCSFRPDPSEGRGVSGRKISPDEGDGGEASAPLSSLGLPANPSGDIPISVNGLGGVKHRVPGPFDGDC